MTANKIRQTFLDFFAAKAHTIVSSAPMVVKNDPTLMFTNAGMNQFKEWFLGNTPARHTRIADTQKCLRVSGKHNDLEEVGHDTYHHTMFEMLGNWSFGDYFKEEAISWAWELLTQVYKIQPDRLYATVFEGAKDDGLSVDQEALEIWQRFLPSDRILMGNKKDNFWEMGDTGPCGPCSEIHVDIRSEEERRQVSGASLVNQSHPLVIEIWNLVFIQYNRKANGSLEPLPQRHVDTGMGLERLCMSLQGKRSNYDTDVFQGLIQAIAKLCGKAYGKEEDVDVAMRVIADHIRAISFSIADGQLPSNVKAGYVIRRILRRAVRYGYTFLGFENPFLCKLVPTLVQEMGGAFPELKSQQALIEKVIEEEELSFLRTLAHGIRLLDTVMAQAKSKEISGSDAFLLYDTYGFPIDLTELLAREQGFSVNLQAFEQELQKQKERSRNATATEEGDWVEVQPFQAPQFIGYDAVQSSARILRYRSVTTKTKTLYQIVLDTTPFYAESGGQTGDSGCLVAPDGRRTAIIDTKKENNLIIHLATELPADLEQVFSAEVNVERRQSIANNHTATHLLHHALRQVLGTHIEQKGSLVSADSFRFDFSHFEKIEQDKLREVERLVNKLIRANTPCCEHRSLPIEQAKAMGAMALFGEKYGDEVRVINFGDSTELCGGTHTSATGNIGFFKILSESAIAAGVRRIEAISGVAAEQAVETMLDMMMALRAIFNNTPNLQQAITKIIQENDTLRQEVDRALSERAQSLKEHLKRHAQTINGISVISYTGEFVPEVVKRVATSLRPEVSNTVLAIGCISENNPNLALMLSDDLVAQGLHAGNIIREAAKLIQGGGGGQPFFATAAGKQIDGLSQAISFMIEKATSKNGAQ